MSAQNVEHNLGEAYVLADHLGLDLLNTRAELHGLSYEFWNSDDDVMRWLARVGVTPKDGSAAPPAPGVLKPARELRELARELVVQRKRGEQGDPAALNKFMRAYQTFPHLVRDDTGGYQLVRRASDNSVGQLLGEVAEAVALLLAEGDFALVKECEHPECVMWFYDRTKAHKRRWCSMAMCGNRHKAAEFRKRNAAAAA
jgi:predicted RNA-binding Zn ribbon-like protein